MRKPTTIGLIRVLSTAIMVIAAYVSYGTQRGVLLSWGVDEQSAALIPITVDLLAIIANLAIHAPGVDRSGRRVAMTVLVAAGLVSMAANAVAGHGLGSRIAHVWTVAAYLLAEWVAAKVKAAKTVPAPAAEAVEAHPVAAVQQLAAVAQVAPQSPAPAGRPVWAPERTLPQWTPLDKRQRQVARKAA